jgi:hypothetical protein
MKRSDMEFVSIREFTTAAAKTRKTLKRDGKLILTNNGKPSMLVFDIVNQDFESLIDILNRAEAMKLLENIQIQSARGGLNKITMKEIDEEIAVYRRNKGK